MKKALTHRERLLREGTKQFYANGFHGTTVDALLEAAEAPKGSFYHHFGSKEEFAKAVVDEYSARTLRTLQEFSADPRTSGMEKVRGYFHELVTRFVAFESRVGCLVGKFSTELAPSSEYFSELLAASLDAWRDAIAIVIAEGQEDGSIRRDVKASQLAQLVLSLIQGGLTVSLAHRSRDALADLEKTLPVLLAPPPPSPPPGHDPDQHTKAHTKARAARYSK